MSPTWTELLRRRLAPRLPALALLALGVVGLGFALQLSFGTPRHPGTGFYPTLVCLALIVFAGISLGDPAGEGRRAEGFHGGVVATVAALAAYALALERVGFILCTAALVVLLLRLRRVSWVASAATGAAASVGCYLAFTRLGLQLPAGVLPL